MTMPTEPTVEALAGQGPTKFDPLPAAELARQLVDAVTWAGFRETVLLALQPLIQRCEGAEKERNSYKHEFNLAIEAIHDLSIERDQLRQERDEARKDSERLNLLADFGHVRAFRTDSMIEFVWDRISSYAGLRQKLDTALSASKTEGK